MRILAATGNLHKIKEFKSILQPLGIDFVSPVDLDRKIPEIEENGLSFEENSQIKALNTAVFTNMHTFADDSGLEVEALNNAPGIFSSRYADNDANRIARLLKELEQVEKTTGKVNRNARFVCVISFASTEKIIATFRGEVYGSILCKPQGVGGFGYDPVFCPNGFDKSFAELSPEEKDSISHRYNALKQAEDFFKIFLKDNYV